MSEKAIGKLLDLIRRRLPTCDVSIHEKFPKTVDDRVICRQFSASKALIVRINDENEDRQSVLETIESIFDCFAFTLEERKTPLPNPAIAIQLLQRELSKLADKISATDVVVIDVASPVLWCSAVSGTVVEPQLDPYAPKLVLVDDDFTHDTSTKSPDSDDADDMFVGLPRDSDRAIRMLRDQPTFAPLPKGGQLRHKVRESDFGFVSRIFADIYALVAIFDGIFDEIRTEREINESLPDVERLVLALPPRDPTPRQPGRAASLKSSS